MTISATISRRRKPKPWAVRSPRLGFGTQFTPDFDFAEGQEKVVDAPVRMARQRQLVDLTEERRSQVAERQTMTERQMSFIRQMAREKGLSDQALDEQVNELYGKRFDQLDRRDASSYIERLKTVEPLAQGVLISLVGSRRIQRWQPHSHRFPDSEADQRPETIDDRLAKLELRLQDGFARIGEAMEHGIEVENWERHWIELLREYESLNDELAEAA